jgi:hypothetical protein
VCKKETEKVVTSKDKKIVENISIIDNSKNLYLENIRHVQVLFFLLIFLIIASFIILGIGFFKLLPLQQTAHIFWGNGIIFCNSSCMVFLAVGFTLVLLCLVLFFILKLRLKEISKYLYSIERLNLLKIALNMIADYQEANSVVKYNEDVRIKTIEKLLDIVKNMDGFGTNTF